MKRCPSNVPARLLVVPLFVVAVVFLFYFFPIATVLGKGMEPTLKDGSKVIGSRLPYLLNYPRRGDVVLYRQESGAWRISRVVGLRLETILLEDDGSVFIDNHLLEESYLADTKKTDKVEPKELSNRLDPVVLGDNRGEAELELLAEDRIIAKVLYKL